MLSVIIPTFNEEEQISCTISSVYAAAENEPIEIIVIDGGSTDDTLHAAEASGALAIKSARKGRAVQMNVGAVHATGSVLYFLHADTIPPKAFAKKIKEAVARGARSGCFRLSFDYHHWFLAANAWFTRFDVNAVRFGDQSLFVSRDTFSKAGGFREDLMLMEDQEIISRLKKYGQFRVLNETVVTSARKYRENGVFRMQFIFYRIWALYYLGCPQEKLLALYRQLITQAKV